MRRQHTVLLKLFVTCLALSFEVPVSASPAQDTRPLNMDDVLGVSRITRASFSPDGKSLAVVIQRPALEGEVFGRTLYEFDPARSDIWLVSLGTGGRINLTDGAKDAAGFWCATWSPDGRYLAMLSTKPEKSEPRGGDNVRLYVWDRATGEVRRLAMAGVMSQTMAGAPQYRTDFRGPGASLTQRCSDDENAPFTWLDNHRILTATLPFGQTSGLIDEYERPVRQAVRDQQDMREGKRSTETVVESGQLPRSAETTYLADLQLIDATSGSSTRLTSVPYYPFRGELTVSVAPDRKSAAVLATVASLPPQSPKQGLGADDSWSAEKRLGFVSLAGSNPIRWVAARGAYQLPLDLTSWSPDSTRVALRARAQPSSSVRGLFLVNAADLSMVQLGPADRSVGSESAASTYPVPPYAIWLDPRHMLALLNNVSGELTSASGSDWYILSPGTAPVYATKDVPRVPSNFARGLDGRIYTLVDGTIFGIASGENQFHKVQTVPKGWQVWPSDPAWPQEHIIIARTSSADQQEFMRFNMSAKTIDAKAILRGSPELLDVGASDWNLTTEILEQNGSSLAATNLSTGVSRNLIQLNQHLASVNWGEERIIEYTSLKGEKLKAAVILPPDFMPGKTYPIMTWVYPGYWITGSDDFFLDPYLPGMYNLQLYAAKGYVVLIPSMPLPKDGHSDQIYASLPDGVLPALDRLKELGLGDSTRIGVMGQSLGGYAALGLVAQTKRFRAAVAISSITDIASFYGQFDPTARGYPGIEHEKSFNWTISEGRPFQFGVPPYAERGAYERNSPITYAGTIEAPTLLLQGEFDQRGSLAQAEEMFFNLYRRGKTAKLVRFWGENHSLSQSPANIRRAFELTVDWLDRHLLPVVPSLKNENKH